MPDPIILDPFGRAIHLILTEEIERRRNNLANGSAARNTEDSRTVAENYAAQVAYIEALNAVLGICKDVAEGIDPRPSKVAIIER